MNFETHPRQVQRFRDAKPACAAIPSYRCKTCRAVRYQMAGRKAEIGGGWNCAECATVAGTTSAKENGPVTAR